MKKYFKDHYVAIQTALIVLLALALCCTGCKKDERPAPLTHSCPFDLCPYKGLKSFTGVIATGDTIVDYEAEGTDVYYIDLLHFEYPNASYDELEEMVFKVNEVSGNDASLFNDNIELITPKTQYAISHDQKEL